MSAETVPGLVARFRAARHDPTLVVLEGFHALKHALRFGAAVVIGLRLAAMRWGLHLPAFRLPDTR